MGLLDNTRTPRLRAAMLATALSVATAGGAIAASHAKGDGEAMLTASIIGTDGTEIGKATFSATASGIVVVRARIEGITPGEHGFHIHETGECDAASGFKSAGGHYAGADDPQHGLVEGGPHAGDMPNVTVGDDGVLEAEVFNPRITLNGDTNPLMDADGSAILVHAGPDDYESQPSGAAGDRVACGVIVQGE